LVDIPARAKQKDDQRILAVMSLQMLADVAHIIRREEIAAQNGIVASKIDHKAGYFPLGRSRRQHADIGVYGSGGGNDVAMMRGSGLSRMGGFAPVAHQEAAVEG